MKHRSRKYSTTTSPFVLRYIKKCHDPVVARGRFKQSIGFVKIPFYIQDYVGMYLYPSPLNFFKLTCTNRELKIREEELRQVPLYLMPKIWSHRSPCRQKVKDQIARDKAERAEKVRIIKGASCSKCI